MFGISIVKTKELKRLRDIDETFVASIRSKKESIAALRVIIKQLKVKLREAEK